MDTKDFYKSYYSKGFFFNVDILTRYCVSLFTKPFVLLTGISGTGKTKIAQLFNIYPESETREGSSSESLARRGSSIVLNITNGMMQDGRGNLPFSSLDAIYTDEELEGIKERIEVLKDRGGDDNITEPVKITIKDEANDAELTAMIYLQRASSPLVRVRLKSKRGASEPYDSIPHFSEKYKVGDSLELTKVEDKVFRISSVNDAEVKEISKAYTEEEGRKVDNKLFVPVKSDWTDPTPLFGFYNYVEQKYHIPEVLRFILLAREHPQIPFYMVFDEMNLSKVEHYFSDFLSCIESRVFNTESSKIIQEKVVLHSGEPLLETDDIYFDPIPNKVEIPENLYVTGTVNIDDTTYMFSPKVLDRANVIEFNEVSLEKYELSEDDLLADDKFLMSKLPEFKSIVLPSKEDYAKQKKVVKETLKTLNEILSPYNLHFGYRIINEVSLLISNFLEFVSDNEDVLNKSIDYALIQKILPKLNGSFGKLDEPLRKLISFLLKEEVSHESVNIDFINKIKYEEQKYPYALRKLGNMYSNLIHNGFTSYIE